MDANDTSKPSMIAIGSGLIIGVLWLAMAGYVLYSAFTGLARGRPDWWLAWLLVGLLLGAAGASAIIATFYHQFRVKAQHH
ncbi:MAG TPA: hypothetical protein VFQ38_23055 [Longimicrobiales bacterium]|nr:hypothetical protein [Longimicrobiales bacterium]